MSEPAPARKATPAVAFCFLLNRLLERESWARERLARFAGERIALRPPLLPELTLAIAEGGRLEPGEGAPGATVGVEGISGGALADEVRFLVRHVRWDAEEELSRVIGDVAAHRLGSLARGFFAWQADAAQRLAAAAADYAADEAGLAVRRIEFDDLTNRLRELEAGIEALERRLRSHV